MPQIRLLEEGMGEGGIYQIELTGSEYASYLADRRNYERTVFIGDVKCFMMGVELIQRTVAEINELLVQTGRPFNINPEDSLVPYFQLVREFGETEATILMVSQAVMKVSSKTNL